MPNIDTLEAALDVADPDNYVYIDHTFGDVMSNPKTPEDYMLDKEKFSSLSEEALLVLDLLFDSPREFKACILRPELSGKGVIKAIHEALRKLGWKWEKIYITTKEIRTLLTL